MPPLETRTDSSGETPEVPPKSMSELHRKPQIPEPTPHNVLGPGIDGRESREAPEQLTWGLAFPEATRAGPRVPVVSLEHLLQLDKIQEVLPSRRDEAHFR